MYYFFRVCACFFRLLVLFFGTCTDRAKLINELEKGILMLSRAKTYAQATGWVGVLIGAVIMLTHMDDPAAIGPGAALALLTALYGTLIAYFICLPLCTKLQVRLGELKE